MKFYKYPARKEWNAIVQRPVADMKNIETKVQFIIDQVKEGGDDAIRKFTEQFDGVVPGNMLVTIEEIKEAQYMLAADLKNAIRLAKDNIETFHRSQSIKTELIETMPGVVCWQKSVPIEKIGLYIPGGTAPLFSTILMLGIPAMLAGCTDIVLCTPPAKDGKIDPAILYTASLVGIHAIFKVGGAQAIAAMAFGTQSIPKVHKVFGPGNVYVTCAKQLILKYGVSIDLPAGPSEVAIFADNTANAAFVASDLLSQAEHGIDSQVLLVSDNQDLIDEISQHIEKQLHSLPRQKLARQALANSNCVLMNNADDAIELLNEYAAEHLILACVNADEMADKIINAGSVFIGNYSTESVGDYASGTNHTLPTNGFAKSYSGVSVDSFVKKITYQKLTKEGLHRIGPSVKIMAEAEGLKGHANAVDVRLKQP